MRRSGVSGCTSVAVAESVAAAESVECAASSRTFPGRRNFQEEGKRGKTGVCQTVRVCVSPIKAPTSHVKRIGRVVTVRMDTKWRGRKSCARNKTKKENSFLTCGGNGVRHKGKRVVCRGHVKR